MKQICNKAICKVWVVYFIGIEISFEPRNFEHAKVNKNDSEKKELKCLLTEGGELLIRSITQTYPNY